MSGVELKTVALFEEFSDEELASLAEVLEHEPVAVDGHHPDRAAVLAEPVGEVVGHLDGPPRRFDLQGVDHGGGATLVDL